MSLQASLGYRVESCLNSQTQPITKLLIFISNFLQWKKIWIFPTASAGRSFYRRTQTLSCLERISARFLVTNATKASLLFCWFYSIFSEYTNVLVPLSLFCARSSCYATIGSTYSAHKRHGLSNVSYNLTAYAAWAYKGTGPTGHRTLSYTMLRSFVLRQGLSV